MDEYMKYVVLETPYGLEVPVIFNSLIDHRTMIPHDCAAVSAGRVDIKTNKDGQLEVCCFGFSRTLDNMASRGHIDDEIILRELTRPR